ncbi:HD domain-containing protein [Streptomyces sp. NBC_01180]|uniref:HD domain-containing protein n=1 Tax=Streptomyces sp. NBC_01180 TaxID=2903763 RepID=UPI00386ECE51|nr:HD domain-containing protein [Streptomyces sp. NBC_01180]
MVNWEKTGQPAGAAHSGKPDGRLSLPEVEALARRVHAGQADKAGQPYTVHLATVAEGVAVRGGTDEQIAAAWLHDSVEDGALRAAWLEGAPLPRGVKDMVFAMTKRAGEGPEAYAARILAVPGALLIKESDIAHNADPRRLAVLDAATRDRLTAKYARMRGLLGLAEG